MNYVSLVSHFVMVIVCFLVLLPQLNAPRKHRFGVTLLTCWSIAAFSIHVLKNTDPLPTAVYKAWLYPIGVFLGAWALLDVTRLARAYGQSTMVHAAEIAKGFLLSDRADAGFWNAWADSMPKAAWLKTKDGVFLAINRHYEDLYSKSVKRTVGQSQSEVWVKDIADQFDANDQEVYSLGAPIVFKERAPTFDHEHRESLFLKFPVRNARGEIVGIGGLELAGGPNHEQ